MGDRMNGGGVGRSVRGSVGRSVSRALGRAKFQQLGTCPNSSCPPVEGVENDARSLLMSIVQWGPYGVIRVSI